MLFFPKKNTRKASSVKERIYRETRKINEDTIDFLMKFVKRKTLEIKVDRRGLVTVSAPLRASMSSIDDFILKKHDWISNHIKRSKNVISYSDLKNFEPEERTYYLGKEYKLKIERGIRSFIEVDNEHITIYTPFPNNKSAVKKFYKTWRSQMVDSIFEERLNFVGRTAKNHGIVFNDKIQARKMKSRYGTCTGDNRIFLNSELVMGEIELIDYVIAHELCHIIQKNHSPRFYKLLSHLMPDWKERMGKLNNIIFG